MSRLYQKLKEYSQTDIYPYHMPGHKRRLSGNTLSEAVQLDITEVGDFDNLHDADGILDQIQKDAALTYGAEESFFLVNGSTSGILSAISAAVESGGSLLTERGCHRCVYHAAYLRNLKLRYVWESLEPFFGCRRAVTAEQVEQALEEGPVPQAVLIVSPTYEGFVADVQKIADAVHRRGSILIVDEAHGAHLGFHPAWAQNSNRQGADLVIQSLHKTLPAPTQTAILHVNGNRVDRERLRRFLRIYQSSSPSYLLMAAMEEAIDLVKERPQPLFDAFLQNWDRMLSELEKCRALKILQADNMDIGKLVVADGSGTLTGRELSEILVGRYHLQVEMATEKYVLAMFTVGDTEEGYRRMVKALSEIDRECARRRGDGKEERKPGFDEDEWEHPVGVCPFAEAWDGKKEEVPLDKAGGRVAAEFINLYPPGVPIIVPGELFTDELCKKLHRQAGCGLCVQGMTEKDGRIYVKVVK